MNKTPTNGDPRRRKANDVPAITTPTKRPRFEPKPVSHPEISHTSEDGSYAEEIDDDVEMEDMMEQSPGGGLASPSVRKSIENNTTTNKDINNKNNKTLSLEENDGITHISRARSLKSALNLSPSAIPPLIAQDGDADTDLPFVAIYPDDENNQIRHLRDTQKLSWSTIASIINASRSANIPSTTTNNKPTTPHPLTASSTYGKYLRSLLQQTLTQTHTHNLTTIRAKRSQELATLLSAAAGNPGKGHGKRFRRDDNGEYKLVSKFERKEPPKGFTEAQDEMLVESVREARAEFWEVVAGKVRAKTGLEFGVRVCEGRFREL